MPARDGDRDEDRSVDPARREAAGVPVESDRERETRPGSGEDGARGGGATGEETAGDPPWVVAMVGQVGVYLAVGSLGVAAVGALTVAAGIQPYGNVAIVLALGGVTVAMGLGMAHQAYVGDYWEGR